MFGLQTSREVHYRIGSLEMAVRTLGVRNDVHYRIGSLEIVPIGPVKPITVHYRIGSLEIIRPSVLPLDNGSLPYR